MNTEMKDTHFSRYADSVAAQIRFPAPVFRLTRWEAFVGAVVALFGGARTSTVVACTVAIVLCLASIGCAGPTAQHGSTFTTHTGTGQRLDALWITKSEDTFTAQETEL